jgi:hypothetical protein
MSRGMQTRGDGRRAFERGRAGSAVCGARRRHGAAFPGDLAFGAWRHRVASVGDDDVRRAMDRTVARALQRRGTRRAGRCASPQRRIGDSDVLRRRRDWFASQLDLDLAKRVVVDETGASASLARTHGRRRRGRRLRAAVPRGHDKTVTPVRAFEVLRRVRDRPMNARNRWKNVWLPPSREAISSSRTICPPARERGSNNP